MDQFFTYFDGAVTSNLADDSLGASSIGVVGIRVGLVASVLGSSNPELVDVAVSSDRGCVHQKCNGGGGEESRLHDCGICDALICRLESVRNEDNNCGSNESFIYSDFIQETI